MQSISSPDSGYKNPLIYCKEEATLQHGLIASLFPRPIYYNLYTGFYLFFYFVIRFFSYLSDFSFAFSVHFFLWIVRVFMGLFCWYKFLVLAPKHFPVISHPSDILHFPRSLKYFFLVLFTSIINLIIPYSCSLWTGTFVLNFFSKYSRISSFPTICWFLYLLPTCFTGKLYCLYSSLISSSKPPPFS